MVHKWRRQYLAATVAQSRPVSSQFMPVLLTVVDITIVDKPVRVVQSRVAKPASPKLPALVARTIEIKFGGATVRINGLDDASALAAVLSHFHP